MWNSGEFHTDKSRIVLNNDGAVITMFIYSISFHMDFNTGLFRRPTKSWSTHQLNSIYTVASLGFIYISSMIVTVVAVRPTYVFSAVVIVAWYTTSLTKHSPFKGHLFGSLQLQGLEGGGVFSSGGVFWFCCVHR